MGPIASAAIQVLKWGAKTAKTVAKKNKSKTKKKADKDLKDSRGVPKGQRTKAQQNARNKKAKELKAARAKAAAAKKGGIKGKIAGALGLTGTGAGLGYLADKLLSGRDGGGDSAPESFAGIPIPTSSIVSNTLKDDPTMDFSGVGTGLMAIVPTIAGMLPDLQIDTDQTEAGLIVKKDVQLDNIELPQGESIPFIPAGTYIQSNISQIGELFAITDALRKQIGMISSDLDVTNDHLNQISIQLGIGIENNRKTRERNERRRDEEAVEEKAKRSKLGELAMKPVSLAGNLAKASILGAAFKYAKAAAAIAAFTVLDGFDSDEPQASELEEEPIVEENFAPVVTNDIESDGVTTEDEDISEEQISDAGSSTFDNIINWIEKAESDESGKTLAQSATGAVLSNEVTAIGVAGALGSMLSIGPSGAAAAGLSSAAMPIAAAAAGGFIAGTIIYEQTGLKEGIESAISDHLAGESIDLSTMASDQAMKEKYQGKQGVELLGDLLGEGMFDLAEAPEEIIAAFKNVDSVEKYQQLNSEYQAEYGRPLTSALNDVLGTKGVDSVFQLITQNTIERLEKEGKIATPKPEQPSKTKVYAQSLETAKELGLEPPTEISEKKGMEIPLAVESINNTETIIDSSGIPIVIPIESTAVNVDNIIPDSAITNIIANNIDSSGVPIESVKEFITATTDSVNQVSNEVKNLATNITNTDILEEYVINKFDSKMPEITSVIEKKIDSLIPILLPIAGKPPRTSMVQSGTQMRSQIESALGSYRTVDQFLTPHSMT